jgi:hypothetical protein
MTSQWGSITGEHVRSHGHGSKKIAQKTNIAMGAMDENGPYVSKKRCSIKMVIFHGKWPIYRWFTY